MRDFFHWVVRARKVLLAVFLVAAVLCLFAWSRVSVNYDIDDYLPDDSPSTIAIEVMEEEFDGGIPNARVMIAGVTVPEALEWKERLAAVEGVSAVTWLDDAADLTLPMDLLDTDTVETYYRNENALFSVTIEEDLRLEAVEDIRSLLGPEDALAGSAVSTATATANTVSEIQLIASFAVLFVLAVLLLTTQSWFEPVIVLVGLGVAIVLNNGTNLIFGEISFVSNAAGSILQLAVSLDYSVFLIHRFEECRRETADAQRAMVDALCKSLNSILSSGLTTVIGFLALVLMRFQLGPDLGLVLAKGVFFSLLTVFLFMPGLILMTFPLLEKTRHRRLLPSFRGFGRVVRRVTLPLAAVFVLLVVPAYLASNANDYYYGASHIFGTDTELGQDTQTIEAVFGKSDTYVLLVPRGDTATEQELSDALHELDHVTGILSYVDNAGAEVPLEYLDEDTLSQLMSEHYSRLVLSVDVDYEGEETFALVEEIRALAEEYYPGAYYLAGEGVSTYDLMDTIVDDMVKVNLLAIGAVLVVLIFSFRALILPLLLVLAIETAVWLNLSVPYFMDAELFYIAYLIISSIQLGATVDYAILLTDRYRENRLRLPKEDAVVETLADVTVSILTSGIVLTVVGLLMGYLSSNQLLAQLGILIGRGAVFSMCIVLLVLPGLLYLFDPLVVHRTGGGKKHRRKQEESAV